MRKSNVGRNRLLAAVALIACLCMMILAGCTGVSRSADKPVLDEATVVRVVDGDTFVANIDGQDEKIRLIGVDTPESVNPDESKNTERGKEASENTKSILTKGKHVWLEALCGVRRERHSVKIAVNCEFKRHAGRGIARDPSRGA